VYRLETGHIEEPVFLKIYTYERVRQVLRGLFRNTFFGRSRAMREWVNLHRLQRLGIAVPQPIAVIESRRLRFLRACALATIWEDGTDTLDRVLVRAPPSEARQLALTTARLVAAMHSGGYTDGDLHPRNLLVKREETTGPIPHRILKIDSPAGRRSRKRGRRMHDLACLELGGRRFLSRSDRLRAWRCYAEALADPVRIDRSREAQWLAAIRARADRLEPKEGTRIDAEIQRYARESGCSEGSAP